MYAHNVLRFADNNLVKTSVDLINKLYTSMLSCSNESDRKKLMSWKDKGDSE